MRLYAEQIPKPGISRSELVKRLQRIASKEAVLFSEEDTRPYECDGLSAYRELPWIVVIPDSIEQVQSVLRTCNDCTS